MGENISAVVKSGLLVRSLPADFRAVAGLTAATDRALPIVLIGGVGEDNARFQKLADNLGSVGHDLTQAPLTEHRFAGYGPVPDDTAALHEVILSTLDRTGAEQVNVVAYSKGGVITRNLIQHHDGLEAVHELMTVATPHGGVTPLGTVAEHIGMLRGRGGVAAGIRGTKLVKRLDESFGRIIEKFAYGKNAVPNSAGDLVRGSKLLTRLNDDLPRLWKAAEQVNPDFHMTSVSARIPHLNSDGTVESWSSHVAGQPERFVSNHEIVSETATHNNITSHDDLIRFVSERFA